MDNRTGNLIDNPKIQEAIVDMAKEHDVPEDLVRDIMEEQIAEHNQVVVAEEVTDLGHHKLLTALYFILDAFERTGLDFFLIRQTARDAMASHELTGDHLEIGVRSNEWANDAKDILMTYFDQEHVGITKQEPGFISFVWQDIPFTLRFYEDNPCVTALIPIAYEYESWSIPNQFERFEKEFDK